MVFVALGFLVLFRSLGTDSPSRVACRRHGGWPHAQPLQLTWFAQALVHRGDRGAIHTAGAVYGERVRRPTAGLARRALAGFSLDAMLG